MLHMWVRKGQGNKFRAALPSNGLPSLPVGKQSACSAGDLGLIPGSEDPLEKEMAIHSSILAWRIPWTEELVRLQSMALQGLDTT